jgi:hypothetical protein
MGKYSIFGEGKMKISTEIRDKEERGRKIEILETDTCFCKISMLQSRWIRITPERERRLRVWS